MDFINKIESFYNQQVSDWNLLAENVGGLAHIKNKTFDFDGTMIAVQHNPQRIKSTIAKTDEFSINQRVCFLCAEHRPSVQKSVKFGNYEILCNPYPIFKQHFTISHQQHTPQCIEKSFSDLLALSKELPDYVVFYNGANCGASAPDHLHFQACPAHFLNTVCDYEKLSSKFGKLLYQNKNTKVFAINDGLRTLISIEADKKTEVERVFEKIYQSLEYFTEQPPMINLLSTYDNDWQVLIFLRKRHRPSQFFEAGERQIVFSPGAVDMGGVLVLPREKDFEKITSADIVDMLQQVAFEKTDFLFFVRQIATVLEK